MQIKNFVTVFKEISNMKPSPACAHRTKFDFFYWKVNKSQ